MNIRMAVGHPATRKAAGEGGADDGGGGGEGGVRGA